MHKNSLILTDLKIFWCKLNFERRNREYLVKNSCSYLKKIISNLFWNLKSDAKI